MEELLNALDRCAAGTPYEVIRTPQGCDLRLNLANAQFYGVMSAQGVKTAFVHHVKVKDEQARTFTVTDQFGELTWVAGVDGRLVPQLSAKLRTVTGAVFAKGMEKKWAFRPDGSFGKVVDYTFDTSEAHGLIKAAATSVGWTEKLNAWAKGGLYAAIGGVVVAIVVLLVLFVLIEL